MPWLDAAWHPPGWIEGATLPFDPADRGLLLGDGVFDTALALGGRMVWREAHVDRLLRACQALGFEVAPARVAAAIDAVLARNGQGAVRVTVTRGAGPRGLAPPATSHPTILATISPLRAAALFAPLKLQVAAVRRNDTSPLSRVKSLNYGDGVLAAREAIHAGCDEALFLNTRERVACTSAGNIFAVIGSQIVTPPLADGVLPGILRAILLAEAEEAGFEPVERSLSLPDLVKADAVLATSSLRLVAQVVAVDRKLVAGGRSVAGLARLVAERIATDVGVDPRSLC